MRGKKSKNKTYDNKHQIIQVILCNIITLYYYILYVECSRIIFNQREYKKITT